MRQSSILEYRSNRRTRKKNQRKGQTKRNSNRTSQRDPRLPCHCHNSLNKPCRAERIPGSLFCPNHQTCKGSPLSGWEPLYDPDRYNKDLMTQETHNCFAYGMNVLDPSQLTQCVGKPKCDLHYHQPGGTVGLSSVLDKASGRSCKVVERLMRYDVPEIRRTTFRKKCPVGTSKIALVAHRGEDYHFYRQDRDGMWSHKDGANPVKRYDARGEPIFNPERAARNYRPKGSFLNYSDFCGLYCVPRNKTLQLAQG